MTLRQREDGSEAAAAERARRIEMILQQLESMPTLSAVAVRLLDLTASSDAQAREIVALVASDPSLSAKVLRLCRCGVAGRGKDVQSVERAVMLLGFEAVRSAVLSVQVFELLDHVASAGGEMRGPRRVFDRQMFWQHSIAVGVAAEMVARGAKLRDVRPTEVFLAGLLHDLGQLALHVVIPATFDEVCALAETHSMSLDAACRRAIGIDAHTAGKRLAESWRLPAPLADALWLSGQPFASLPDLPHRRLIGLVTLADTLARRLHLAPAGHAPCRDDLAALCEEMGIASAAVVEIIPQLHAEVTLRADALGLQVEHSSDLLLRSISRANDMLGRVNTALEARRVSSQRHARLLRAVARFQADFAPAISVAAVLGRIIVSAREMLGGRACSALLRADPAGPWRHETFARDGRPTHSSILPFDRTRVTLDDLAGSAESFPSLSAAGPLGTMLPALGHGSQARVTALPCGGAVQALLLHDGDLAEPRDPCDPSDGVEALLRTWGAALAAAAEHERASRLSEQLAETNRELADAHDQLARSRTMASLGEIAAGAAHEMNNPLTVISGRAQLLATALTPGELRPMAEQIAEQSTRLSELITALRSFAEPMMLSRRSVDFKNLLRSIVDEVRPRTRSGVVIHLESPANLPATWIDPALIGRAVREVLLNAIEAPATSRIDVRVQIDEANDRLTVQVADDGPGLTEHGLAHAFDPFFSGKPAGRQPGLGLAHARRAVEAHGGRITLANQPQGGAVATISLGGALRGEAGAWRAVA
jgi:HD-like signal output (HDOD) protein/nitrogen-specific signal transduction histidine kinase